MEHILLMLASPLVKLIIDKIEPFITKRACLPWQVRGKLRSFKRDMDHIHTVLVAAETFGLATAELWKKELNSVLYDMDDLFDYIDTEDNQVINSNPLNTYTYFGYSDMIADIEKALTQIKEDAKDSESILKSIAGKCDYKLSEKWTQPTHSFLGAESFIGRRDEKEDIVEFLLSEDKDADSLSIVGIGGLGKTALAKMVFNDSRMKSKFELKWAHVSFRKFDLGKVVCEILEMTKTESTLQGLLNILQEKLHDKPRLFVLDDVWDMDPVQWNELKDLLLQINKGNKVLMTTRYQPIANLAVKIISLKPLSPDLCLPLIEKYAKPATLSQVSDKVIKKCEGVPLAAITLGLMLFKTTLQDDIVWSLGEPAKDSNIMHSLKLSYDNLKLHVKRCFEYHVICNDEIDKESLVQMWSAQGFIEQTDELEKAFKKLEEASFFSNVKEDTSLHRTQFKVLRLFHDLVFLVSTDYSYIRKPYNKPALSSTTRHVHVLQSAQTQTQQVQDLILPEGPELKKLRTFVGPHEMKLSNFKRLRVLNLCLSKFKEVPVSICNMKHLRYLYLSQNQCLEELPRSDKLFHLKTLRLDKCGRLRKLPDYVGNLKSLKHLYLENLDRLEKLPKMSHCTALETLEIFGCPLFCFGENDLKYLKNLRRLALVNLPKLVDIPKVTTISAGIQHSDQKLTSLCLSNCGGLTKLPEWFGSLTSLERLTIDSCDKLTPRCNGEDWCKIKHVKEIYLNKSRIQSQRISGIKSSVSHSAISDCHEPNQEPEKGGENKLNRRSDDIHDEQDIRPSNIASLSSGCLADCAKRKRKWKGEEGMPSRKQ